MDLIYNYTLIHRTKWGCIFRRINIWIFLFVCLTTISLSAVQPDDAIDPNTTTFENWNILTTLSPQDSPEQLLFMDIPIVVTASKYDQAANQAPAYATVVTATEIRRFGYQTLADILRSVPGLYTTYDRNYSYVGVNGFCYGGDYNTRILFLVDGHRLNEGVGDTLTIGTEFLVDVDNIERVEVIRGPGSSLYGSNAVMAVINVITKTGDKDNGGQIMAQRASHDTTKGRLTWGRPLTPDINIYLSGTRYSSNGQSHYYPEYNDPATLYGRVRHDEDRYYTLFGKLNWSDASLVVAHNTRDKNVPTGAWETVFGDPHNMTRDYFTLVGLTYQHEVSEEFSIKASATYNHMTYYGGYTYDYAEEEDEEPYLVVNKDYSKARRWTGEIQCLHQLTPQQKLTYGIEWHYNQRQDQFNYDEEVYLYERHHSNAYGLYVQDEFNLTDRLSFITGLRFDEFEDSQSTLNPRLAAIWNFTDESTLKLLYGTAFRAPNMYELLANDGGYSHKAPQGLDPETITTCEAVLEHRFNKNWRGLVSLFRYKIDDLILHQIDPADELLVFANIGSVKAQGVTCELHGRLAETIKTSVSYSYVDARDGDTDRWLANSPHNMIKAKVMMPLINDRCYLAAETRYDGKRRTLAENATDDAIITDLTLTFDSLIDGLDLTGGVRNLFNVSYAHPGSGEHIQDQIRQDGVSYFLRLTYRF
ncbi:MAG: TonB-dependent receptor [Sedimentisphaerales bacterium]|nr:TonB-dependent receptor [Sedimentisphaerales bacterium]